VTCCPANASGRYPGPAIQADATQGFLPAFHTCVVAEHTESHFYSEAAEPAQGDDFSYIYATEGWLYVAMVLERFAVRMVNWSMNTQTITDLATNIHIKAI
jgi:hypothetical protein